MCIAITRQASICRESARYVIMEPEDDVNGSREIARPAHTQDSRMSQDGVCVNTREG